MSTTPAIDEILKAMRERPEARAAIRREVLSDELLEMPETLAKQSARIDRIDATLETLTRRVDDIAARLETLTRRVDDIAARLETLTRRVDDIAARLETLTRRVDDIAARLETLTERMDTLTEVVTGMSTDVQRLFGDRIERRAAFKLPPVLSQGLGLRRARAVYPTAVPPSLDLGFTDEIEDAAESGLITEEQETRLKVTDLIFHARRKSDGARVWFAVEASGAVGPRDIERASESAAALEKIFGEDATAVVTGHRIRLDDRQRAEEDGVIVHIDDDPWS